MRVLPACPSCVHPCLRLQLRDDTTSTLPPPQAPLDDETIAALLHRPWGRRFATQFAALTKKNLLVNWRNLRSTVLRVLAPL